MRLHESCNDSWGSTRNETWRRCILNTRVQIGEGHRGSCALSAYDASHALIVWTQPSGYSTWPETFQTGVEEPAAV